MFQITDPIIRFSDKDSIKILFKGYSIILEACKTNTVGDSLYIEVEHASTKKLIGLISEYDYLQEHPLPFDIIKPTNINIWDLI